MYDAIKKEPQIDIPAMQKAFDELKHRLATAPILKAPDCDPEAPEFIVSTDASEIGWGAVLEQADETLLIRPC